MNSFAVPRVVLMQEINSLGFDISCGFLHFEAFWSCIITSSNRVILIRFHCIIVQLNSAEFTPAKRGKVDP